MSGMIPVILISFQKSSLPTRGKLCPLPHLTRNEEIKRTGKYLRRESNPHDLGSMDFKSTASTNSATEAFPAHQRNILPPPRCQQTETRSDSIRPLQKKTIGAHCPPSSFLKKVSKRPGPCTTYCWTCTSLMAPRLTVKMTP
jgi:hypothetical protein